MALILKMQFFHTTFHRGFYLAQVYTLGVLYEIYP